MGGPFWLSERMNFLRPALLILAVVIASCVFFPQAGSSAGIAIQKDVMVPMRDGIQLATDIYLPADENGARLLGKFPVLLVRTPYDKGIYYQDGYMKEDASDWIIAIDYVVHDYVVVIQDTRGRYKSQGVWHMLTDDGPDGYDTARWIGRQSWSNGRIGMIGTSYEGGTQHAMAMEKPPELKTVVPVDAMSNLGYASIRNGGAFELRFWNWIIAQTASRGSRQTRDPATRKELLEMVENRRYYLQNLPLRPGTTPLSLAAEYEDWLVEAMKHGVNDEFWAQNNIIDYTERYKDIPVYLIGGWYDSYTGNTLATYKALSKQIKGPVYLIMGPWRHGAQRDDAHGQVSFGKEAAITDTVAWRLQWYDHWLKGTENKLGKQSPFAAPVRIFVMGTGDEHKDENGYKSHGGYWRDEQEWPLSRTRTTNYYFHEGGALSTTPPMAERSSTSFRFDPRHPVPTIGGNISAGHGIMVAGAWDQRGGEHIWNWPQPIPLSARNDVVVFQTAPLSEDVEVTGEIEVKLWASSSAVDTDFTAKLIDVHPPNADYPGGFDMNIADGILRARFRGPLKEEKLLKPGTIYELTIKPYPTSNIFKKGHRIRVDISSSNFPRFDVNPNTGEPLNDHRRMVIATNTVYHNREHASHIILPVIPHMRNSR